MPIAQPIFARIPAALSCHAATIVEASSGILLAAWFAGTHEGHPDVGIWMARYDGAWSAPSQIAAQPGVPHWNPVLFRDGQDVIWLFYKIGPSVPAWTGMTMRSHDHGRTWSAPTMLPAGLTGPQKNKPITLQNGDILSGSSCETWQSWTCWIERSQDGGNSWTKHGPIIAPDCGTRHVGSDTVVSAVWDTTSGTLQLPQRFPGVIQPALWEFAPGKVKMLMRSTQAVGCVCASVSEDAGRTWSFAKRTPVPNPNSGLDAVRLSDGRIVLVCNPVHEDRSPLSALISEDNGITWPRRIDLKTGRGEFSYPSVIQTTDRNVHVVATHLREQIFHYVLDPGEL